MSTEISNPQVQLPSYIDKYRGQTTGLEEARKHAKPSRLKIVQSQTKAPYKPPFKNGDVIVQNLLLKIGDEHTPFTLVPLFYFTAYVSITPYDLKSRRQDLPTIVEVSFDSNSALAKKCEKFIKSDPYTYTDQSNKQVTISGEYAEYRKQLNFLCLIEDLDAMRNQVTHFWFSGGEFKYGQQFIGRLQVRNSQYGVPMWVNRFRAASIERAGVKGNWYGYEIGDDPQPFVEDGRDEFTTALHEELKAAHASKSLEIDYTDAEDINAAPVDPEKSKF